MLVEKQLSDIVDRALPQIDWSVGKPRVSEPMVAYLVDRRAWERGRYPQAEPIVLVDQALAHRYQDVREIELIDPPVCPELAPELAGAGPLFVINAREDVFYPRASRATIVADHRGHQHDNLVEQAAPREEAISNVAVAVGV
jgi:hypothetical protein